MRAEEGQRVRAEAVTVRRARRADWPELKVLRLEALADTPIGFLETLEEAQALDDAAWKARETRGGDGGDSHQVLAFAGGRAVGTCVTFSPSRVRPGWPPSTSRRCTEARPVRAHGRAVRRLGA
jgi:hypothetical protein